MKDEKTIFLVQHVV